MIFVQFHLVEPCKTFVELCDTFVQLCVIARSQFSQPDIKKEFLKLRIK
jgi:hypothetical protein